MRGSQSLPALKPSMGRYSNLESTVDMFMHANAKVASDERFVKPLPLTVAPAQNLTFTSEPLTSWRVAVEDEEELLASEPARLDCTLSLLGIGRPTLVVLGGRNAHGDVLDGPPLACDAMLQQWAPIDSEYSTDCGPCARSSHTATVLGSTHSLLAVCGGEDAAGQVLGDTRVLEMRAVETMEEGDARRSMRAERGAIFETLVQLRSRQHSMRGQVKAVEAAMLKWEAMLEAEEGDGGPNSSKPVAAAPTAVPTAVPKAQLSPIEYVRKELGELRSQVSLTCMCRCMLPCIQPQHTGPCTCSFASSHNGHVPWCVRLAGERAAAASGRARCQG